MNKVFMLIVVLLPMFSGALVPIIPFRSRKTMCVFIEISALVNSVLVFLLLWNSPGETLTVFRFTGNLSVTFRIDGMG